MMLARCLGDRHLLTHQLQPDLVLLRRAQEPLRTPAGAVGPRSSSDMIGSSENGRRTRRMLSARHANLYREVRRKTSLARGKGQAAWYLLPFAIPLVNSPLGQVGRACRRRETEC
jgi:hypothetical protein